MYVFIRKGVFSKTLTQNASAVYSHKYIYIARGLFRGIVIQSGTKSC